MDKELATLLVENILKYCEMRSISQTDLGNETGLGQGFVTDIKRGRIPRVDRLLAAAEFLGVTTSDLVGDARAAPATSDLDKAAADLNDDGRKALLDYAAFLASKDEYKKFAQTDLGKEA